MRRGPRPEPTALKILKGNPGQRRLNLREPIPDTLAMDCPPELTTEASISEWTRTIIPGILRRQITAADRCLAIAHCELWSTWREQLGEANRFAHVVATRDAKPMANPARRLANQSLLLLIKVDGELGLAPASRSRVQLPDRPTPPDSKWAGLLG